MSDGVGVGVIMNGEVLRGRHNIAGEFGHVPLSLDGPRCSCGANGCWEAYISNRATLARYFGRALKPDGPQDAAQRAFTIDDLVSRARGGDGKAIAALEATARYLGLGLASIINAVDPAVRLRRRRDHGGLGPDCRRRPQRARRADAAPRRPPKPSCARCRCTNIRDCTAPRRWSRRRRSPRRWWPDSTLIAWMDDSMTTETLAPTTCVVRNTAGRTGRTQAVAAGPVMQHLHYGRIILEADAAVAFSTGRARDRAGLPARHRVDRHRRHDG